LATSTGALRAELATSVGAIRAELATKPSRGGIWPMRIALFALVLNAMAAGMAYLPLVEKAVR
jgi:hypothetical protein